MTTTDFRIGQTVSTPKGEAVLAEGPFFDRSARESYFLVVHPADGEEQAYHVSEMR